MMMASTPGDESPGYVTTPINEAEEPKVFGVAV